MELIKLRIKVKNTITAELKRHNNINNMLLQEIEEQIKNNMTTEKHTLILSKSKITMMSMVMKKWRQIKIPLSMWTIKITIEIIRVGNRIAIIIMIKIFTSHKERAPIREENITKDMRKVPPSLKLKLNNTTNRVLIKNRHQMWMKAVALNPPRKRIKILKIISIQILINNIHQARNF